MELASREICSGCHGCYNACPIGCISMVQDEEGFLQPEINNDLCVSCGKCRDACPVLKAYRGNPKGKAFACINKDEDVRMNSSSGGVFTLIGEYVLDRGGAVFGAAFDEELRLKHIEVRTKAELYRLRGSKYLQSEIGSSFRKAKEDLEKGEYVLFTGTPCQISGLKSYLGKDYDRLILQDIVCHGVPSPGLWQIYLRYRSAAAKAGISRENPPVFRVKDKGWNEYRVSVDFDNGKKYRVKYDADIYMRSFLKNLCLRRSCYNCHSKSLERESDITLADFWGVDALLPEMFDDKGTSLVFVNSEKGRRIFEAIAPSMIYRETDMDGAVRYNSPAVQSCALPAERGRFMNNVTEENFKKLVNKYAKEPLSLRAKYLIKSLLSKPYRFFVKPYLLREKHQYDGKN